MKVSYYDVIIVGSGAAGLTLALEISNHIKIGIISKQGIEDTASYKAQGGIAAVVDQNDSFQSHVNDTLSAGGALCDLAAVKFFVEQSTTAIRWLTDQGVSFDRNDLDNQSYALNREGGHARRRVLHVHDETGKYIVEKFFQNVQKKKCIECLNDCIVIDLLVHKNVCIGCLIWNRAHQALEMIIAKAIVLATGGASAVYEKFTHSMATGDGIAMAYRAGCHVEHMEFCQFHPTCFQTKKGLFLISETLRGEGGRLTLPSTNERFMLKYDSRGELAPRDIVARAMTIEMKKHCLEHVNLDISHRNGQFIKNHFPKIYDVCLQNDIDITHAPIPVFPAAHYTCGGVKTDLFGQTNLIGLFAIGEVACTRFHGANRLASNSLLECVVSALNLAKRLKTILPTLNFPNVDLPTQHCFGREKSYLPIEEWRHLIREIMWTNVGIVRSDALLAAAKSKLFNLSDEIERVFPNAKLTQALIEVRNLAQVACLIVQSAFCRKENCGAHYNIDNPHNAPSL
jgi:L-aspartate oxidase